ncbi:hypothetical protein ABZ342_32765 [Amycolatopsis sp. NPDC005961]|uniref:hypothetical protein n=1 Tax=Amycolatopsis sp. NPDC005961 TaxID=3156720 RepID=UPI0033E69879
MWILEQGEAQFDKPGGFREVLGGLVQAFGQALALATDVAQLLFDLVLRHRLVVAGGQVDQLLFLGTKVAELRGELLSHQARGSLLVLESGGDMDSDVCDELWAEADSGVVGLDSFLDV